MNEGQRVTYVGPSADGLNTGTVASLLAFESTDSAHIQVSAGVTYLVPLEDLTTQHQASRTNDGLDDSLDVGGLSTFAVRQVFDLQGESGVVDTMAHLGHLAGFEQIAEEALTLVASRVRQDPSFREVLAHLDAEEGEAVLRLAVGCLIRDAFGDDE